MSDQHWEYFTFDGIKSSEYGVWISGENTFATPERDVTVVEIPGRNGTLTMDNGRWKNVQITYPCFMSGDFKEGFDDFKNAILPKYGYLKLEDTYHPTGYRMARLLGGIKPKPGPYNRSAQFSLTFDCWPQFYLYPQGAFFPNVITIMSTPYTITDIPLVSYSRPTVTATFAALPYGDKSGSVTVGSHTMTWTDLPYGAGDGNVIKIDSEAKTITMEKQGVVTDVSEYFSGDFFEILPPTTAVSYSGAILVTINPKWWSL